MPFTPQRQNCSIEMPQVHWRALFGMRELSVITFKRYFYISEPGSTVTCPLGLVTEGLSQEGRNSPPKNTFLSGLSLHCSGLRLDRSAFGFSDFLGCRKAEVTACSEHCGANQLSHQFCLSFRPQYNLYDTKHELLRNFRWSRLNLMPLRSNNLNRMIIEFLLDENWPQVSLRLGYSEIYTAL